MPATLLLAALNPAVLYPAVLAVFPGLLAACPKLPEPADGAKVAVIDGKAITKAELDKEVADELCKAKTEYAQKLYDLRRGALDELLADRLLAAEAKKRGLKDTDALEAQLAAGARMPDESVARQLYEQAKDRLGGRTYEDVRGEILEHLRGQVVQQARQELVTRLKQEHKVQDSLEPLRFPVEAKGPVRGPAAAPVTIVMFADFQCPYCSRGADSVEAVRRKHPNDVRVIYRDYPLSFHPLAQPAAVAARCAGAQGKFWEMHDKLFANQQDLGPGLYNRLVAELHLDAAKFQKCSADPAQAVAIKADFAAGEAAGVDGTPAFFINGVRLSGAQPPEAFEPIIAAELAKKSKGGK